VIPYIKLGAVVSAILGVILYTGTVFYYGTKYGESITAGILATYVAEQQDKATEAYTKRIAAEYQLKTVNDKHEQNLAEIRKEYEKDKATSDRTHTVRLQQLETRERSYRLMSQATDAERRALADTAAELDRVATEGRYLVGELRRTLVLRDKQLIEIGVQIRAERSYGK
jgi:hypothetical protein